jgi:hypothetical protein
LRCRTNLDQVEVGVPGKFQGTLQWNDTELFAVVTDKTNLSSPDLVIYSEVFRDRIPSLKIERCSADQAATAVPRS